MKVMGQDPPFNSRSLSLRPSCFRNALPVLLSSPQASTPKQLRYTNVGRGNGRRAGDACATSTIFSHLFSPGARRKSAGAPAAHGVLSLARPARPPRSPWHAHKHATSH